MSKFRSAIVVFVATASLHAFATALPQQSVQDANAPLVTTASVFLALDGIYKLGEEFEFLPQGLVYDGQFDDDKTQTVHLSKDEPVAVSFDKQGNAVVDLVVSEDDRGKFPEQVMISKEDFERGNFTFVATGDINVLNTRYEDFDSTEVASRRASNFHSRGRMHFMGASGCVAFVLSKLGWWKGGRSGNGTDVTNTLLHSGKGYKVLASCKSPPIGAVASWSGGRHGSGHTAMWNGSCWAYDIACGDPGHNYHFKNCVAR